MRHFDVVIVGAGLAGLQCAGQLAAEAASVLLVDRKADLSKGVHTTGIFVRKTFEDFEFPPQTLGRGIRHVNVYSPGLRSIELESESDEFRIGRMGPLYEKLASDCISAGVEFWPSTRFVSVEDGASGGSIFVLLERNGEQTRVAAKVLVGADGANSAVARSLGLDQNREMIVGVEEVFHRRDPHRKPALHCFLDSEIAPGYLAWIADDGAEVHIGVGGYSAQFKPREALAKFKEKIAPMAALEGAELVESRGGRIPVGGILRNVSNRYGLLIGDAAGAVSPLTAGGLDPCMRLSRYASSVITERLRTDDPNELLNYSGRDFRARFVSRLFMRRAIALFRSQLLLEIGFGFLRTRLGTRLAKHIFFGRGSFPDMPAIKRPSPARVLK